MAGQKVSTFRFQEIEKALLLCAGSLFCRLPEDVKRSAERLDAFYSFSVEFMLRFCFTLCSGSSVAEKCRGEFLRGLPPFAGLQATSIEPAVIEEAENLLRPELTAENLFDELYEMLVDLTFYSSGGKELCLTRSKNRKKANSAYYTPHQIVDYMISETLGGLLSGASRGQKPVLSSADIEKITVIDPAMGSGRFLSTALERLTVAYLQARKDERKERLSFSEAAAIIASSCLYGIDNDPLAVLSAKLNIALRTSDPYRCFALLDQKFKTANALLSCTPADAECGYADQPGIFVFEEHFPLVFAGAAGGFSACLGNPPYGQITDEKIKGWLCRLNYRCPRNNWDAYAAFLELSCRLLAPDGHFALIVPNTFLVGPWYKELRLYFAERKTVQKIVDFGRVHVFDEATTFVSIVSGGSETAEDIELHRVSGLSELSRSESPFQTFAPFGGNIWAVKHRLAEELERSSIPLGQLCTCCDSGLDYNRAAVAQKVFYAGTREDSRDFRWLRGADITPFKILPKDRWLRHDWRRHLDKQKKENLKVNQKAYLDAPKLLTRQTGDRIICAVDSCGYYIQKSLHSLHPLHRSLDSYNIWFLAGCLNSSAVTFYYRSITAHEVGKALSQVKIDRLRRLPIPSLSAEQLEEGNRAIVLLKSRHEPGLTLTAAAETAALPERIKEYVFTSVTSEVLSVFPLAQDDFTHLLRRADECLLQLFGLSAYEGTVTVLQNFERRRAPVQTLDPGIRR